MTSSCSQFSWGWRRKWVCSGGRDLDWPRKGFLAHGIAFSQTAQSRVRDQWSPESQRPPHGTVLVSVPKSLMIGIKHLNPRWWTDWKNAFLKALWPKRYLLSVISHWSDTRLHFNKYFLWLQRTGCYLIFVIHLLFRIISKLGSDGREWKIEKRLLVLKRHFSRRKQDILGKLTSGSGTSGSAV